MHCSQSYGWELGMRSKVCSQLQRDPALVPTGMGVSMENNVLHFLIVRALRKGPLDLQGIVLGGFFPVSPLYSGICAAYSGYWCLVTGVGSVGEGKGWEDDTKTLQRN